MGGGGGGGLKLQEDGQSDCHSRVKDCRFTFTDRHHQSRLKTVIQDCHSRFEITVNFIEIKNIKIKKKNHECQLDASVTQDARLSTQYSRP